jgi:hypothetical protein
MGCRQMGRWVGGLEVRKAMITIDKHGLQANRWTGGTEEGKRCLVLPTQ